MANSTNLILPFIEAAQAQKHVTHNEAILALDAIVQLAVLDRDLTAPPGSPADGDRYIVAATATGAWAGQENNIAARQDGVWKFFVPREGWLAWVADENVAVVFDGTAWGALSGVIEPETPAIAGGRLTVQSGAGVPVTDQAAKSTLYFTPFNGNVIALFDGTRWHVHEFSEMSLALSGFTANKNSDIFLDWNDGSPQLAREEWTGDTTRATALTLQDGVHVKSGDAQQRYLGTIRTTGTAGETEDSRKKRYVWNLYNKVPRIVRVTDLTFSYVDNGPAWKPWLNNTANRFEFVRGLDDEPIRARFDAFHSVGVASGGGYGACGAGAGQHHRQFGRSDDDQQFKLPTSHHRRRGDGTPRLGRLPLRSALGALEHGRDHNVLRHHRSGHVRRVRAYHGVN